MMHRRGNAILIDQIDHDLYRDRLTGSVVRHAIVGSDGGVYDPQSFLQILQHGGMSLVNPLHRLTSAVRIPSIENMITNIPALRDEEHRIEEYDLARVMAAIARHLSGQVRHVEPVAFAAAVHATLEMVSGLSAVFGLLSTTCLISLYTPGVNLFTSLLGSLLFYEDCSVDNFSHLLSAVTNGVYYSSGAFAVSTIGLFAGKKLGIFTSPQNPHVHQPAPGM